ncbi:Hsp70 family protein [Micromonospora craniellae]|uniref:Hsp70 family protein n=1 Tax=Micromonospora craniellae TaxID=2294034 RepID=A0A372FR72_9ACTN|nr:Hsp70 family protein [Micromonospora craniellae]QOC92255.1 Hsp70 family protein [Micromonospora craniellae]RFS40998.1 Hsp70 family protein [Micromonospora craniellae]
MAYGLGIDVGTTFTAAALAYDTHAEMLTLGDTALVAPSVVFAGRDGRLLTGDVAVRAAEAEPGRAIHEFKRRLGDPTPIVLGERGYAPTELIAAVVRDVVDKARAATGEQPGAVVLTCPAIWGPYRLEQFTEVATMASLDVSRVVTEPEAAATFYLSSNATPPDALLAVYDLGGGTFDTAVIRSHDDRAELLGNAEGVDGTGGMDLDQVVLAMVDEQLDGAVSRLVGSDPAEAAVLARLRTDAVRAKESLSSESAVVMAFFLTDGPHEVRLTRPEFEHRIAPLLAPTIDAVRRALDSAGLEATDLDAILLSGGSSRVPLVLTRLSEEFGRPVLSVGHPKHVVALGAAMLAYRAFQEHGSSAACTDPDPAEAPRPSVRGPAWQHAARLATSRAGRFRVTRRTLVASLSVLTVLGLMAGVVWWDGSGTGGQRDGASLASTASPTNAPPSTASAPAASAPARPASTASGTPAPAADNLTGQTCAAIGPTWSAGYGSLTSYPGSSPAEVRRGSHEGHEVLLVRPSSQLDRRSIRGNGYIRIGHAYLVMEASGDLLLYRSPQHLAAGSACAAWRTGTGGNPGAYLRFQPDGNLVVYAPDGRVLWASRTCCDGSVDALAVRADGNLLLVNQSSGRVHWTTGTAAG